MVYEVNEVLMIGNRVIYSSNRLFFKVVWHVYSLNKTEKVSMPCQIFGAF